MSLDPYPFLALPRISAFPICPARTHPLLTASTLLQSCNRILLLDPRDSLPAPSLPCQSPLQQQLGPPLRGKNFLFFLFSTPNRHTGPPISLASGPRCSLTCLLHPLPPTNLLFQALASTVPSARNPQSSKSTQLPPHCGHFGLRPNGSSSERPPPSGGLQGALHSTPHSEKICSLWCLVRVWLPALAISSRRPGFCVPPGGAVPAHSRRSGKLF